MRADDRWFGFWRVDANNDTRLPTLSSWIDPTWGPGDKEKLLSYINNSPVVIASSAVRSPCIICGMALSSSDFQSDGTWLWPADLRHYMSTHHVRIPDSLANHIRQRGYDPPKEVETELDNLPWP